MGNYLQENSNLSEPSNKCNKNSVSHCIMVDEKIMDKLVDAFEERETNIGELVPENSTAIYEDRKSVDESQIHEKDKNESITIFEGSSEKENEEESNMEKRNLESDCVPYELNQSNKENYKKSLKFPKKSASQWKEKKKSKRQIKEERFKIQSETQRLMREREISIPYHVPKQRTLKEFLARKKNRANIPLYAPPSKMQEIWKDIEESTKNAFDFFKSDSDSDTERDERDNKNNIKSEDNDNNSKTLFNNNAVDDADNNDNDNVDEDDCIIDNNQADQFENGVVNQDINPTENQSEANSMQHSELSDEGIGVIFQENENSIVGDKNNQPDGENDGGRPLDSKITVKETTVASKSVIGVCEKSSQMVDTDRKSNNSNSQTSNDDFIKQRTSAWINDIPMYEKYLSKKEMLLQKLNPKLLKIVPKLCGEPNSIINLENDASVELGAKKLMQRFFDNCAAAKHKTDRKVKLTVTNCDVGSNGEIRGMTTEKLIYNMNSHDSLNDPDLVKPGAKLQRLREELKRKIEEKWEEEQKRKTKELEEKNFKKNKRKENSKRKRTHKHGKENNDDADVDDDVNNDSKDGYEEINNSEQSDVEEDEYDLEEVKSREKNEFICSEADESDCEDEESGYDDEEIGDKSDSEGNESGEESQHEDAVRMYNLKPCSVNIERYVPKTPESFSLKLTSGISSQHQNASSQCSLVPPYQPRGGMLREDSILTLSGKNDSLPDAVFTPTVGLSLELSPGSKNELSSQNTWDLNIDTDLGEERGNKTNFVPHFSENGNYDISDAFEFCSGKFPDETSTQPGEIDSEDCGNVDSLLSQFSDPLIRSQGSLTLKNNKNTKHSDLIEIVRSHKKKKSRLRIISDTSDDEEEEMKKVNYSEDNISDEHFFSENSNNSEDAVLTKSRKRKKILCFSDDDDSDEDNVSGSQDNECDSASENGSDLSNAENEDCVSELDPNSIEYDSEENEIIHPAQFFDKEAELSGSEISGDEDEKDLDELDAEDGDNDKFDENHLRSQLEKIHVRRLLDDDNREIRLLQEILFEDGDLYDGQKREKKFKWKNLGDHFDDDVNNDNEDNDKQSQEDVDEQTAKIRHEKELFFLQLKNKREETDSDDFLGQSLLKKGKVVFGNLDKPENGPEKSHNFYSAIDELANKTHLSFTMKRGSFLSRNDEFLSKLAKLTSNSTDHVMGPKYSKNFVFSTKSPEKNGVGKEISSSKRKSSSKNEICKKKKLKLEMGSKTKTSLLDQLS